MNPLLLLPCLCAAPTPGPVTRTLLAMGTTLSLKVEGGATAVEPALAEVAALEARCSTWRAESLWSRLNAGEPVALPEADRALLTRVAALSREVEGAFDPMVGRLVQAWGLRTGGRNPTGAELAEARAAAGLDKLQGLPGGVSLQGGAWLEEGGFLKGHALDRMAAILHQGGATRGLLDFGGQLLAWGPARTVAVAHPQDRLRPHLTLRLRNASLSTTGTSERGLHLLDPRTGRPCGAWGAVAVVRPTGLEADILSTALYVMGPDRGSAWAEAHGVAAAFLLNDGTVHLTAPFRGLQPRTL